MDSEGPKEKKKPHEREEEEEKDTLSDSGKGSMRTRLKFREIIDENQMSVPLEKLLRGRSTIENLLENKKKGSVDRPTTAIQKESTSRLCSVFYHPHKLFH